MILNGRFAECGKARHRAATQAQPEQPKIAVPPVKAWVRAGNELMGDVNFWNARNNLRNRNPCGDPSRAPRCGARARTRGNMSGLAPAVRGLSQCACTGASALVRAPERGWSAADERD